MLNPTDGTGLRPGAADRPATPGHYATIAADRETTGGYRSPHQASEPAQRTAFPQISISRSNSSPPPGEGVAFAYALTGTQTGPLLGHPPTSGPLKVRGMQIGRFDDEAAQALGKQ